MAINNGKYIWTQSAYWNTSDAYVRKTFELLQTPDTATLNIFVDDDYELYVNGNLVATDMDCTWYTNQTSKQYDIKHLLIAGTNAIAIHGRNCEGPAAVLAEIRIARLMPLALTDVIVIGIKEGGAENELLRIDKDGNQLWQTTVPVSAFWPNENVVDRNLKEDTLYLVDSDLYGNIAGFKILKYDRYGNLEWQKAFSTQYTWISANPVEGGIYASNTEGISKIDASGTKIWGPINWGYTDFREISTNVKTGGFFVSTSSSGGKVIKANPDGTIVWEKSLPDPGTLRANPVDGGVYVYSLNYPRSSYRMDTDGNIIWSQSCFPSCYIYGIAVSPLDGSLTMGTGWPFVKIKFGMDGQIIYKYEGNYFGFGEFQIAPDIETGGFYGGSSAGGCVIGLNVHRFDAYGQMVWEKPIGHFEWSRYMIVLTGALSKVSVDNIPPVLNLPSDMVVEATGPNGAVADYIASAIDDVDGAVPVVYSIAPGSLFPFGITTVTVTATDSNGNTATGTFTVTVCDTTLPIISVLTPSKAVLWPPNNKMVPVTVSAITSDNCDPSPVTKIISVSSNEPANSDAVATGNAVITGNLTLNLRAQRNGNGNGRIYTITVQCEDISGNITTETVIVVVPHDQGK